MDTEFTFLTSQDILLLIFCFQSLSNIITHHLARHVNASTRTALPSRPQLVPLFYAVFTTGIKALLRCPVRWKRLFLQKPYQVEFSPRKGEEKKKKKELEAQAWSEGRGGIVSNMLLFVHMALPHMLTSTTLRLKFSGRVLKQHCSEA